MRHQSGVRSGIARQHGEKNVFLPRERRDLFQPIGPVGGAAEQPQDDETGGAKRLFEIEIDRVIMAQRHEVGEAEGGQTRNRIMGAGQRRQFGIGGRDDDNIARLLRQIDRLDAVADNARLDGQNMHGLAFQRAADGGLVETFFADDHQAHAAR